MPTSDEDIGGVCFVSRLGGDTQGVEPLVLFVEVCEGQSGFISTPVHLVPFRWRQQNIWEGTRWRAAQEQTLEREALRYFVHSLARLTVSVPLDLRLVAVQSRVDDDRASQTHGLTLSSKRYPKLVDNVSLEGDAILRHWALCR